MQHLDPLGNPGYDLDGFKPEAGRLRLFGGGGGGGKKPKTPPAPEPPKQVQYAKDALATGIERVRRLRYRTGVQSTLLVAPVSGGSAAKDFASAAGPQAVHGTLLVPVDTGGKLV